VSIKAGPLAGHSDSYNYITVNYLLTVRYLASIIRETRNMCDFYLFFPLVPFTFLTCSAYSKLRRLAEGEVVSLKARLGSVSSGRNQLAKTFYNMYEILNRTLIITSFHPLDNKEKKVETFKPFPKILLLLFRKA